ncbi:hypothetical protein MESS2_1000025 [Mesorhizobium metallidurans STM 2683]|uniref:Ribbon-helix-helix domain-containing protein n=1 Tax=Mesorhizobium metallidurans STM 2683 TaxID=1297569 RepID=M5ETK3_9HYPH|nr:hypothetical protein MESS2_1000025 [Mesorhizobium metallidurans STM 2683]
MCKVYARQDPEGYRQTNRSVRVAGHSTSIQLEAAFWTSRRNCREPGSVNAEIYLQAL